VGVPLYRSRAPVAAAQAQLDEIRKGNLAAAYARTTVSYQAAHPLSAFAAFVERHPALKSNTDVAFTSRSVEDDTAKLSGTLTHSSGTESVVYSLVEQEGAWKISGLAVGGDESDAGSPPVEDSGALAVEILRFSKAPQGSRVDVRFDVRVTGFDLRPEGAAFRVDLVEDLETFGPEGRRMDELSRPGLMTFNRTTSSATGATATFKNAMTFARPTPGRYRAIVTIRDQVGQKSKKREVAFDLP
jgi:hypothetical protein